MKFRETRWLRRLLTSATLLMICACSGETGTPEQAVRAWLAAAEIAAEAKNRAELVEMISPDYADARGNDRDALDKLFRYLFLRQKNIALLIKVDNVEIFNESAAKLDLTVGMAATGSNALGLDADAYRFEFDLVENDGEWLLTAARWGELGRELE